MVKLLLFQKKKKEGEKKKRTNVSRRETSAGMRDTASFQASGSVINQALSCATAESADKLSRLLERKGKTRQWYGMAEPQNPARHVGASLLTVGCPGSASPHPIFIFDGKRHSLPAGRTMVQGKPNLLLEL